MTPFVFVALVVSLGLALSLGMVFAWFTWRRTGNSGWIDTVWTFGLGATCVLAALMPDGDGDIALRQRLVAVLFAIWSLRLGLHIAYRTYSIVEDPRYAALERQWGDRRPRQMFILLQKQALVSLPLAISVVLAAWKPAPLLGLQDLSGVLIIVVAIAGATFADRQLRTFRANKGNCGKLCNRGLWAWSRHPNYFFECLGWIAYPVIAIDLSGGYAIGWLAIVGPVCIYWLLRYVSGVPPLEAHMLETRGDAFRRYQATTSEFFPWPPKAAITL
jgi:steroid 5-alpha reductase family enzyme